MLLKELGEEETYYYHPDHLGSVSVVSNHKGEPYERVEYLPFGEMWIEETDPATGYIPFRFTSKEYDEETGLYYHGARYYEPRLSRWMSADPAGWELINPMEPDGEGGWKPKQSHSVIEATNWYAYVSNNPVKYVDPTGLTAEYDIDQKNKVINVSVEITVYGDDATQAIADEYKQGIIEKWGTDPNDDPWEIDIDGQKYSVNFNVNITIGKKPGLLKKVWNMLFGTMNYVEADSEISRSKVLWGFLGKWRTEGRYGMSFANDNPAAHEFGHMLGFKDRYHDKKGINPGWENNLMGESRLGIVEQRNIDALGGYIGKRNQSSGIIRFQFMRF